MRSVVRQADGRQLRKAESAADEHSCIAFFQAARDINGQRRPSQIRPIERILHFRHTAGLHHHRCKSPESMRSHFQIRSLKLQSHQWGVTECALITNHCKLLHSTKASAGLRCKTILIRNHRDRPLMVSIPTTYHTGPPADLQHFRVKNDEITGPTGIPAQGTIRT